MDYKLTIYGNNMYKEFVLDEHFKDSLTMGTRKDCQICFQRERFLTDFVIQLEQQEIDKFVISCSNTIYFKKGKELKDYVRQLRAGDRLIICYHDTEKEFFYIDFSFDFKLIGNDYNLAIDFNQCETITIGGTTDSKIRIDDPNLSNDCVLIRYTQNEYLVNATHTQFGIFVNGCATRDTVSRLHDGEFFSLKGYSFNIRSGVLYTTKNAVVFTDLPLNKIESQKNYLKYPKFKRNVRQQYSLSDESREILKPKAKDESEEQNFLLTFMPVLVNLLLMVVLRGMMGGNAMFILYFAGTMLVSTTMSAINYVGDKKRRKVKEAKREAIYLKYIEEQEAAVAKLRKNEKIIANQMHPRLDEYIKFIEDFDSRLFEKEKNHEDYLSVRIGNGILPSSCQISYKQEEYVETEDELMEYPKLLHDKYQYLDDMPVLLNLKDTNAVGFIGARTKLYQMEKNLIVEFAASHFYKDVKLFLIMDEDDVPMFEWSRWLQNTYNNITGTRNFMYDKASAKISLEFLYSELSRREGMKNTSTWEDYIIFVYKSEVIQDHPVSEYVSRAKELGFHFVFFEEHEELLNSECSKRIFLNARDFSGYIQDVKNGQEIQEFQYTHISREKAEAAAKRLACVYVDEVNLEHSLTKNITLFELLNILSPYDLDLNARWSKSKIYESMAAPLGVKSGNEIVYLDLHEKYHGPHGLVAGTTGSGKSEIMQSYILSMATLFHPYEVGFIIIDFKGGGMANQFRDLPHLIGTITNIDGKEIERSLMSIKAELIKRQELFAKQSVNHINDYIRAYKEGKAQIPLPHLILIVDEFAELKSDQPEFMKELISAARIGRSLGIHLILATQKPSGVVNDQIWSNSKFKLCLKVQNKSDSNEVLKSPLAAEIREPGRAYLQVGNDEIFQLFQSAYSGALVQNDDISKQRAFKISSVELSGERKIIYEQKPEKNETGETQLVSIINYVHDYCESQGIQKLPSICLPPLDDNIVFTINNYQNEGTDIVIPVGIIDDPERQQQYIETFNLSQNNYLIMGSSQSGKTNLLQTIIRGLVQLYSPKQVQLYILDFASMILKNFENLNHIGGVITANTEERLKGLVKILQNEIQMRKNLLSRMGLSSYSSYRESGMTDLPQLVILLDNWIGLKNTFAEYEEIFIQMSRECVAVGISLVVTVAQAGGIGYKFLSSFSKRVAFYCNDSSDYNIIFESCRRKLDNISGRGIVEKDKKHYECQFYHSFAAEKEFEKINLIQNFIQEINQMNAEFRVKRIPEIPEVVTEQFLVEQYGESIFLDHQIPIGMEFNSVDIRSLSLETMFCMGLVGDEKSGRVEYVNYIISRLAADKTNRLYIIDNASGGLKKYKEDVLHYTTEHTEIQGILNDLLNTLEQRKMLIDKGQSELKKEPQDVVIINSADLAKIISKDRDITDIFNSIMNAYRHLKVCFLFTDIENARISISAGDILKGMNSVKHYLVFENISNIEVYDVPPAVKREYKKALEFREAYYINGEQVEKVRTVKGKKI